MKPPIENVTMHVYVSEEGTLMYDVWLVDPETAATQGSVEGGECTSGAKLRRHRTSDWMNALNMVEAAALELIVKRNARI